MVTSFTSLNSLIGLLSQACKRGKFLGVLLLSFFFGQLLNAQCDIVVLPPQSPLPIPAPPNVQVDAFVILRVNPNGDAVLTQDSLVGILHPQGSGCHLNFYEVIFLNSQVNPKGRSMNFNCGNGDSYVVQVTSDTDITPGGAESQPKTLLVILEDNYEPVFQNCPGTQDLVTSAALDTNDCHADLTWRHPVVFEPCGLASYTVSYSAGFPVPTGNLPVGGNVIGNALVSAEFPVGQTIITYVAEDFTGNTSVCEVIVNVRDDEKPLFRINDITVDADNGLCYFVANGIPVNAGGLPLAPNTYFDNCGVVSVEYSRDGGLNWNDESLFAGEAFNLGKTRLIWRIKDEAGNTTVRAHVLTVVDGEAPVFNTFSISTVEINSDGTGLKLNGVAHNGSIVYGDANASDCGARIFWLNPGASDNCNALPLVTANYLSGHLFPIGTTTVTITAQDNYGNNAQLTFDVTVHDNQVPVIAPIAAQSLSFSVLSICGPAGIVPDYSALVNVTDNCDVTWTQLPAAGTPIAALYANKPLYGVTDTNNDNAPDAGETFNLVITATDANGNVTIRTVLVTLTANGVVNDFYPAVAGIQLPDYDANCGHDTLVAPLGYYYDANCDLQQVYGKPNVGTLIPGSFPPAYIIPVPAPGNTKWDIVWTYTYNSVLQNNATTSQTQEVFLEADVINPVVKAITSHTLYLDATGSAYLSFDDVENGSTDNCGIVTQSLSQSFFDCSDAGFNTVQYSVRDKAGNTSSVNLLVFVVDNLPPTMQVLPNFLVIGCDNLADTALVGTSITFDDNCAIDGTFYNEVSTKNSNPASVSHYNYTINRFWTAEDLWGNLTTAQQTIYVLDVVAPEFSQAFIDNDTIRMSTNATSCLANVNLRVTANDVADNCAPFNVLTIQNDALVKYGMGNGTTNAGGNYAPGVYEITFTVTDPTGNFVAGLSSVTKTVIIEDKTPPVAACRTSVSIAIPSSGQLVIPPSLINNSSFDYCSSIALDSVSPSIFTCADADGKTLHPITLYVSDANGNQATCATTIIVQDNIKPVAVCQNISVDLQPDGTATISAAQLNNGSSDNCTDASLLQFTANKTSFGLTNVGANTVTLTVTDSNGNKSTCNSTVTVVVPQTCFDVVANPTDTVKGRSGTFVDVPVVVSKFISMQSFQFRVIIENENIAEFVGLGINNLPGTGFTSQVEGKDTISLSYVNNSAAPVTLADGSVAFTLRVRLKGPQGPSTRLRIVSTPSVPAEVIRQYGNALLTTPACTIDGFVKVETPAQLVVSGTVRTESNKPVGLVDLTLFNSLAQRVGRDTTGSNGFYLIAPVDAGNSYTLCPDKDINWTNGVTAFDLALIQRHIVGIDTFGSVYTKIAADANNDGRITSFDVLQLHILLTTAFTGNPVTPANNKSWRFAVAGQTYPNTIRSIVPAYTECLSLPNLNAVAQNQNFIGIKIGNVNDDGDPSTRSAGEVVFTVADQAVKAGEVIRIPVKVSGHQDMISWQWLLQYDYSALQLKQVNSQSLALQAGQPAQGKLGMVWYNTESVSLSDDSEILFLEFTVLKSGTLSQFLQQGSSDMTQSAWTLAAERNKVRFEVIGDAAFTLLQNQPNPWMNETAITFSLPEAGQARISIMDATGKVLLVKDGQWNKGWNTLTLQRDQLGAAGVLFYQLESNGVLAVKKMIVLE